jgi:hypothetical protein
MSFIWNPWWFLFLVATWSSHIELYRGHGSVEKRGGEMVGIMKLLKKLFDLISSTNDGGCPMLHHLLGFLGFLECRCKGLQASEILCFSLWQIDYAVILVSSLIFVRFMHFFEFTSRKA